MSCSRGVIIAVIAVFLIACNPRAQKRYVSPRGWSVDPADWLVIDRDNHVSRADELTERLSGTEQFRADVVDGLSSGGTVVLLPRPSAPLRGHWLIFESTSLQRSSEQLRDAEEQVRVRDGLLAGMLGSGQGAEFSFGGSEVLRVDGVDCLELSFVEHAGADHLRWHCLVPTRAGVLFVEARIPQPARANGRLAVDAVLASLRGAAQPELDTCLLWPALYGAAGGLLAALLWRLFRQRRQQRAARGG